MHYLDLPRQAVTYLGVYLAQGEHEVLRTLSAPIHRLWFVKRRRADFEIAISEVREDCIKLA